MAAADAPGGDLTHPPSADTWATPTILRLQVALSEDHMLEEYEEAVEAVLGRLELLLRYDES